MKKPNPERWTDLKRRRLGELYAEFIGPVAPLIMDDLGPNISEEEALDRLVREIHDGERASEFLRLAGQILQR